MAETEKQRVKRKKRRKFLKGHTYQKPSVSPGEVTGALNLFMPTERPLYGGSDNWMKGAEDPPPPRHLMTPEELERWEDAEALFPMTQGELPLEENAG